MSDELITQAEAAVLRGISVAAINDLVKRRRIRSEERYGKTLVYRSDIENFKPVRAGWPKGKSRKATVEISSKAAKKKRSNQQNS
jgi:hypothetical protein